MVSGRTWRRPRSCPVSVRSGGLDRGCPGGRGVSGCPAPVSVALRRWTRGAVTVDACTPAVGTAEAAAGCRARAATGTGRRPDDAGRVQPASPGTGDQAGQALAQLGAGQGHRRAGERPLVLVRLQGQVQATDVAAPPASSSCRSVTGIPASNRSRTSSPAERRSCCSTRCWVFVAGWSVRDLVMACSSSASRSTRAWKTSGVRPFLSSGRGSGRVLPLLTSPTRNGRRFLIEAVSHQTERSSIPCTRRPGPHGAAGCVHLGSGSSVSATANRPAGEPA